jgi:hypothetical protein
MLFAVGGEIRKSVQFDCGGFGPAHYAAPLRELQMFDRHSIDCGVEDGSGIDVEGVANGHWFAFHADNPDWCKDTVLVLVSKVLTDIG